MYELGYLISWYVTEVPEETKLNKPMIALMNAQKEQIRILQQVRDAGFDTAELDYYQSLAIGPDAKALPMLKRVVAEDPQALHGAGYALLAETSYRLPDLVGGDLELATTMMRSATERAPENSRYARLLAGYLLDAQRHDETNTILRQILSMQAGISGRQLKADQLRLAAGMAERIGDHELAIQLSQQRKEMLDSYPFLRTRKTVAAMGHFGDKDPMADPD